ncbi:uncharacterized protein N7482_010189 [Penicillium canariense]|uniref:Uncharacterized protein n=1 Tax=Penicillium canariense TaxID=189055 RepID=A0A9W9LE61_9EURO|nr:uncharacterized protein N7482_010189 [Penicillium canariense]KAJ5150937.1 hypothetical protein N7482_010189 [Penicillium canariense]
MPINTTLLLHVTPLASTTGTLAHALLENIAFTTFLDPSIRSTSDTILPTWFARVFRRAVWTVLALNVTTIVTTATVLHRGGRGHSQTFYWAGLVGAVGHLCFVPWVMGPVERIVEGRRESKREGERLGARPTVDLEAWLRVHWVRMCTVDLMAWIACVGAVCTL